MTDSFEVGYRKPPRRTQFVKGRSGNPKGRPKGSQNFATVIQSELRARVPVTENGKRKNITKRGAVAKQLVNKAASGDPKAISTLLSEARQFETDLGSEAGRAVFSQVEDQKVMANILARVRAAATVPSESSAEQPSHGGKQKN